MNADAAWESLLERSISAYYEGNLAEGRLACDQLLCMPELPAATLAVTRRNQVHYARRLGELAASYRESALLPSLGPGAPRRKAIIADDGNWLILIETASGPGDHQLTWTIDDRVASGRPIQTIVRFDDTLHPIGSPALVDEVALGSTYGALRSPRMRLDGEDGIDPDDWVPVLTDDAQCFLSCRGPTVAVCRDAQSGALTLAAFHDAPFVTQHLHGASPLVDIGDAFLSLASDIVTWENGQETTLHRFVRFDRASCLTDLSHPFLLHGTGIETIGGLARQGDALAFTYCTADHQCSVASLDLAQALTLLQPVPLLAPHGPHAFPMPDSLLALLARWAPREPSETSAIDPASILVLRPEAVIAAIHIDAAGRKPSTL